MQNLKNFLPTPQKFSQEVIATLGAVLVSAWIISQFPAVKKYVKDSTL